MCFDSDVLIWVFRGRPAAQRVIKQHALRYLSVVTYMELMQGVRDKAESQGVRKFVMDAALRTLPLTENIGHRASVYMEQFALSTGLGLADALIAATAVENNLPLCTANVKHFRAIRDLRLEAFKS